jgi:hypothetical protein
MRYGLQCSSAFKSITFSKSLGLVFGYLCISYIVCVKKYYTLTGGGIDFFSLLW